MLVTILISTLNKAGRLGMTLEGFTRLRLPQGVDLEIVVANNGSTDQTNEVLGAWSKRLPLRSVWEGRPGVSRARNAALAATRGELVIFTDDDVTVPPGWVAEYFRAFKAKGAGFFFGGPIDSDLEGPLPDGQWLQIAPASVRGLEWGTDEHPLYPGQYFTGANWACASAAARSAGGFDVRMGPGGSSGPEGGEENDLMERLTNSGLKGWYLPGVRITHWVPADKTRPEHLLARWQTLATVMAWKGRSSYGRVRLGRIPWRLYPELAIATLRSLAGRMGLADRQRAEMERAWCKGAWTGFRLPPP